MAMVDLFDKIKSKPGPLLEHARNLYDNIVAELDVSGEKQEDGEDG